MQDYFEGSGFGFGVTIGTLCCFPLGKSDGQGGVGWNVYSEGWQWGGFINTDYAGFYLGT